MIPPVIDMLSLTTIAYMVNLPFFKRSEQAPRRDAGLSCQIYLDALLSLFSRLSPEEFFLALRPSESDLPD